MKHHCHCGIKGHFDKFRFKRLGVLGAVLMIGHVLFHVVECLVLPALLVAWSGYAIEENIEETADQVKAEIISEDELMVTTAHQLYQQLLASLRHSSST